MNSVFSVALPVFGIIAVGLIAGSSKLMNAADSAALNKFVFRFAMPAALFGLTAGTTPPGKADLALAISFAVASLGTLIVSYHLSRAVFHITKQEAGAHALTSTLGNAVFLGLPIALAIDGWARPFVTLMLIEGTMIIAIASALMAPRREGGTGLVRFANYFSGPIKNPLVIAMAAGFIYSAIGLPYGGAAETFFGLLGRAAGPTALFSLGLFLTTHQFPAFKSVAGRVSMIAAAKLVFLPIIALVCGHFLGVTDPNYRGALALFVFVPSAVGSFVMASQYGHYKSESAAAVSFTTLLSVITIATVLFIFT